MPFTIPGADLASTNDLARWYDTDLAILASGLNGVGVISGCAVTAQGSPDMTVAIAAGFVRLADGTTAIVTAGNGTITAADGTNPRLDLVSVSTSGVKTVTAGTAAASPKPPDLPSGHVALALVSIPASDTTIGSNQIVDKRVILPALMGAGWQSSAYPDSWDGSAALTTAQSLPANGGSVAVEMALHGWMLLEDVAVRNTDTATARTWGWDLYQQKSNSGQAAENVLDRVARSTADENFTPGAASNHFISANSAPVILAPGIYRLVIQNRHATNTFGLGTTAANVLGAAVETAITKTTTNPNGSTLDFVAATWTKQTFIPGVAMRGRVFGKTAVL